LVAQLDRDAEQEARAELLAVRIVGLALAAVQRRAQAELERHAVIAVPVPEQPSVGLARVAAVVKIETQIGSDHARPELAKRVAKYPSPGLADPLSLVLAAPQSVDVVRHPADPPLVDQPGGGVGRRSRIGARRRCTRRQAETGEGADQPVE